MAKIITDGMRKAIKKMAEISNLARALNLMPTPEEFALMLIGDMKKISSMMNRVSSRMNEILERYANIPTEFLLKGFDEILEKIDDINDYTKFAINETLDVASGIVDSATSVVDAVGSAVSTTTSAVLQVGGGLTYGTIALGANMKLAMTGNGKRAIQDAVIQDVISGKVAVGDMEAEFERRISGEVGDENDAVKAIRDWTETAATKSTESIDEAFNKATGKMDDAKEDIANAKNEAGEKVDEAFDKLTEKVEKAKREVEEKIAEVKKIFDKFIKDFDDAFGFIKGAEGVSNNIANTAREMGSDSAVLEGIADVADDITNFIKNFSIGKVVSAIGGLVVGAGTATLAMDLLPSIDIDRMLKDIIGGIESYREDKLYELYYNKYYENAPDLFEVPDVPWLLSIDDLEKYNAEGYNKYLEDFADENNNNRSEILEKMQKVRTASDLAAVSKENREIMKENKSALKAMRKVRRDAIKAKQLEKYKEFLKIEIDYLKNECKNLKYNIKNEWDSMMFQYKDACKEISRFFTVDGYGGSGTVDRCCDRINEDAEQIVELCKSITIELTNTVAMVPTPYAIGVCVDMPVHKILAFFKDVKIIITFLKNLIRLGIDIISQLTILIKLIANGLKSLKEIFKTLKKLIGVDVILDMIDFLIALFGPKMAEAKILLENSLSPIYYNETEDYEERLSAIEALLDDEAEGGNVETFKYTDDVNARKKYRDKEYGGKMDSFGGKADDDETIEDWLEELEAKGEREIVAYRSPILNAAGDDFAGWIFYHADAYDDMYKGWNENKKRRRNKVIKKASKKNKMVGSGLRGGVAQLKTNMSFGHYNDSGRYISNSVTAFDAYYWYTKWTNDPTDCTPDMLNEGKDVVVPIQTTANGSLVELEDGRRVFVEGKTVKSGDFVNVNGVRYRVK
jgi:hypothetical protein